MALNHQFPSWMGPIPRQSAPWSEEEELELKRGYDAGISAADLCKKHGRGLGGIESRLARIDPDYWEKQTRDYVRLQKELAACQKQMDDLQSTHKSNMGTLKERFEKMEETLRQRSNRLGG